MQNERTFKELLLSLPAHEWIEALAEMLEIADQYGVDLSQGGCDRLLPESQIVVSGLGWDMVVDAQLPLR